MRVATHSPFFLCLGSKDAADLYLPHPPRGVSARGDVADVESGRPRRAAIVNVIVAIVLPASTRVDHADTINTLVAQVLTREIESTIEALALVEPEHLFV